MSHSDSVRSDSIKTESGQFVTMIDADMTAIDGAKYEAVKKT
jgi:hypothetical protein